MTNADRVKAAADFARARPQGIPPPKSPPAREPPISLPDLMGRDFPPARYMVGGILTPGLTVLAGAPKSGKSWMAYQVAIAVAGGYRCLGGRVTEQAPVLYLALEDTLRRLKSRAAKLLDLADWDAPPELALNCAIAAAGVGGLELVSEWWADNPGGLVVIDTLQRFRDPPRGQASAYADDYLALAAIQTRANAHGGAALVLHHTRKMEAENPFDRISGTQGIGGAADTMLVLERRGNSSRMFATGRDLGLATYELDFGDGLWAVTGESEGVEPGEPAKRGPPPTTRKVAAEWLEAQLAAGPMPKSDIEAAAGSAGHKWTTVERAAVDLGVEKSRAGFGRGSAWSMPASGPDPLCQNNLTGMDARGDESPRNIGPDHSRQVVPSDLTGMAKGEPDGNGHDAPVETIVLDNDDRPEGVQ